MSSKARNWLGPAALGRLKSLIHRGVHYTGDYADWESALRDVTGYDSDDILQRVREAAASVRDGRAVCERDGVIFDEAQLSFPVLAGLLRAFAASRGRLSVVDFGGALGSSYYQCRDFLSVVPEVAWSVVEQQNFVRCGREEFQNGALRFDYTIAEAIAAIQPNVALFSGVLQYVSEPYAVLQEVARSQIKYLIFDRLACSGDSRDHIAVQHVPASIYKASYPIRIFASGAIERELRDSYCVVAEFDCLWDGSHTEYCGGLAFASRGLILERKRDEAAISGR